MIPEHTALPSYIPDDYHSQYDATEYLIQQGVTAACLYLAAAEMPFIRFAP